VIYLYIDPGAGSLVIQGIIATALAIPFLFRTHLGRAVAALRGRRNASDQTPTDD
jgi:hypothetical protein